MSTIGYCRDRGYKTTHVTPRLWTISDQITRCRVNYARTDQLEELRHLVQLAEQRGDNVGQDEFADGSSRAKYLYKRAEIFTVTTDSTDQHSGLTPDQTDTKTSLINPEKVEVIAFIAISPCPYSRGYDPCLATVWIFRSARVAGDDRVYCSLVHLAVQLTDEINCGYTHIVVDVALCHVNLLRQLKDGEGFDEMGVVEDNVYVIGVGVCSNVILVKPLAVLNRPVRSTAEVLEMLERVDRTVDFIPQYPTMSLPQVPFLPQMYTFLGGLVLIYRNMRQDEDRLLFAMLTGCVESGEGYGVNEYPSLDYFRMHVLADGYTIVLERLDTNEVIGFTIISNSSFARGMTPTGRNRTVIKSEYRNKGLGIEAIRLESCINRELGYMRSVANTFATNERLKTAVSRNHVMIVSVGCIPHAGFLNGGQGWTPILVGDVRCNEAELFTKVVEENNRNHAVVNTAKL